MASTLLHSLHHHPPTQRKFIQHHYPPHPHPHPHPHTHTPHTPTHTSTSSHPSSSPSRAKLWYRLPTSCRSLLLCSIINTILQLSYSITAVTLDPGIDEEFHISIIIGVTSLFILYAVVDAIIHENSMELAASGVLGLMILARVAWFAATSTSGLNFTVTWTVLLGVSQAVQILLAALSYRQFGWRLYSQLGVDVRRRGASARWRAALLRHGFWTVSKLDIMFLIVLSLLGVDVSVEKRETVQVALLTVAVVGFFVGLSLTIFGGYLVRRRQRNNSSNNSSSSSSGTSRKSYSNTEVDNKLEFMFHCLMPLSFAQPIATIAIYALMTGLDLANAGISLNIASAFFMITRLVVWVLCTLVLRTIDKSGHNNDRDSDQQQQRDDNSINNKLNNNHHHQKALDPLMAGTWLGKPTPNNPKKIRFIQLSQDCSTLRWGWHGYVRLFYVEELTVNEADMTLTISFALDPLLILKFFDKGTFDTWRMGLDKAMLTIMAPTADVMTMNTTRNTSNIADIAGLLPPPSRSAASSPDTAKSIIATISSALSSPSTSSPSVPSSSSTRPLHLEQSESKDQHALSKLGVKMAHGGSSLSGRLSSVRVVCGEQTHPQQGDGLEVTASIQQKKRRSLVEFLMRHQNTGGEDENRIDSMTTAAAKRERSKKKKKISNKKVHLYIDTGTQTDTSPPLLFLDNINGTQKEEVVIQGDEAIAAQYMQAMAGAYLAPDNQDDNDNDNGNDKQIQDDQPDRGGGGGGSSTSTVISNIPPLNDCWLTAASITVDIVEYQDLTFGKLLGDGSEGSVYAAWLHDSPVAIKQFNNPSSSIHEVQMYLKAGTHDNIVGLRGLCMHDNNVYLVLEYCPRGTLDLLIHDSSSARRVLLREQPDKTLLPIVRSIARGVRHLHMRGIIHRDLKSGNIFVGHGYQMKVGDLGCARLVTRNEGGGGGNSAGDGNSEGDRGLRRLSPGVIGTQKYSAPELTNTDLRPVHMADWEWASKVDVWSFGCVVWELIERKRPFEGMSDAALAAKCLNDPFEMRLPTRGGGGGGGGGGGRGVREEKGKRIYRGLEDLVEDCTRVDPLSRPSFKEILRRLQALA
jgi:hypothetical protein